MSNMNQQQELEARYKANSIAAANADPAALEVTNDDPFPRMIIVCIGITLTLLVVILGFLFYDFVIRRPDQNVRSTPTPALSVSEPGAQESISE